MSRIYRQLPSPGTRLGIAFSMVSTRAVLSRGWPKKGCRSTGRY
jgi:hypothetical protein